MVPFAGGPMTPVKGRYYFVDGATEFEQHSMLGGHWWEGHPFQTGEYATLDTPRPSWVNGASPPTDEGWPFGCCCGHVSGQVVQALGEFHFPNPAEDFSGAAHAIVQDSDHLRCTFGPIPTVTSVNVDINCNDCSLNQIWTPICAVSGSITWLDEGLPDPGYMVTILGSNLRLNRGGVNPLNCRFPCTAKVRLYGP